MWWRRRAVVKGVLVMVVAQVFVAVCVPSLLQQHQQEQQQEEQERWKAQMEAPERVGPYVILFKVPTTASIEAPMGRTKPPPRLDLQATSPSLFQGHRSTAVPGATNPVLGNGDRGDGSLFEHQKVGIRKESESSMPSVSQLRSYKITEEARVLGRGEGDGSAFKYQKVGVGRESEPSMPSGSMLRSHKSGKESKAKIPTTGNGSEGDGSVADYPKAGTRKEHGGQPLVKETGDLQEPRDEDPMLDYRSGNRERVFEHRETAKREYGGQALEKEGEEQKEEGQDEEDPNIGRGFVDEYVTYRSDGNSFILVHDDHSESSTTNKTTPGYHNNSGTMNERLQRQNSNSKPSRYENVAGEANGNVENEAEEPDDHRFELYDPSENHNDAGTKNDMFRRENSHTKPSRYENATVEANAYVESEAKATEDQKLNFYDLQDPFKSSPRQNSYSKSSKHQNSSAEENINAENGVEQTQNYKFKSYDPQDPFKMTLTDDQAVYFKDIGGATCFIAGTDMERSSGGSGSGCRCLEGYFGDDCGIPEAAWFDTYRNKYPKTLLRRRTKPRRVINGITVNHEFAMFEARLHELYKAVDVFIVAESNYTAHGDPKSLLFLERLKTGYMRAFQDKLLYVGLGTFPAVSQTSGWIADSYLRFHLSHKGLPLVQNLRDDDLFVLSDADELPTREVITFLKLYDGYTEPVFFAYQWNVFGFFWKAPPKDSWRSWLKADKEEVSEVGSVVTIGMLRKALYSNAYFIRKPNMWQYYDYKLYKKMKKYKEEGHVVKGWVLGKAGHYAGWHCSWCFSPANMVVKMDSAQAEDRPRWGSMPAKKNLTYIASRIREGLWFDDKKQHVAAKNPKAKYYAPRYLLEHPERYRSLLYHPDHPLNRGLPWAPP